MSQKHSLTRQELQEMVDDHEVDTVVAVFPDLYGRLMGKRFDANYFLESTLEHGTHACNYLLTVDMEMEPVPGYATANWDQGYGDFHLVPDLNTLRIASWRLGRSCAVKLNECPREKWKPRPVPNWNTTFLILRIEPRGSRTSPKIQCNMPVGISKTITLSRARVKNRLMPPFADT